MEKRYHDRMLGLSSRSKFPSIGQIVVAIAVEWLILSWVRREKSPPISVAISEKETIFIAQLAIAIGTFSK